jgi:hypothetical protein
MSRPDGFYWLMPPADRKDRVPQVVQIMDGEMCGCGDDRVFYLEGEEPPHRYAIAMSGTLIGPLVAPAATKTRDLQPLTD